jgi:thioredoxin reductase (NADPH)
MKKKVYDVIIIGTGPAGISASIYTSRANLSTLLIGKPQDGALYKAHVVANYFGFDKDISGKDLIMCAVRQTQRFGTELLQAEVVSALKDKKLITIKMADGKKIQAKYIIIATGKSYKILGAKNEEKLSGKGVHYCATCDGYYYKKKNIVVVGHGNLAAEEAMTMYSYTPNITLISNGLDFKLSPFFTKELKKKKIALRKEKIKKLIGTKELTGIELYNGETIKADGAFMALGRVSAINFATKLGIVTKNNDIIIDRDGKTNVEGVYAGGNCTGGNAQAANSVGEGCNAALTIIKKIKGTGTYIDYN